MLLKAPPIVVPPVAHVISGHVGDEVPPLVPSMVVEELERMPRMLQILLLAGEHEGAHERVGDARLAAERLLVGAGPFALAIDVREVSAIRVVALLHTECDQTAHEIDRLLRMLDQATGRLVPGGDRKRRLDGERRSLVGRRMSQSKAPRIGPHRGGSCRHDAVRAPARSEGTACGRHRHPRVTARYAPRDRRGA